MSAPGGAGHDRGGGSLLAVFAHPDDESLACGGLLALSADAAAHTSLLCLSRGEHGPGVGAGATSRLADVRARELHEAARVLGVRDVVLLEHQDGMLPWLDAALLERDILETIRRLEPDVVVTFDEDGLYWHPDHVAVHERVTAAVAALGPAGPALFYVSVPAGAMRRLVQSVPGASRSLLGVDPEAFGAHAPPPTLVVDAAGVAARKLAALRCHRSQVEGGALAALDEGGAARLLGLEHYRRAPVGRPGETFIDRFGAPHGYDRGARPTAGPGAPAQVRGA